MRVMRVIVAVIVVALVIVLLMGFHALPAHSKPYPGPRPRFERILHEENYPTDNNTPWYVGEFEVWHDKETGDEVVCAHGNGYSTLSCWKTGRNW